MDSGEQGSHRRAEGLVELRATGWICCWAALRNQANGVDIVATAIRQDGRWARLHNDSRVARIATGNFAHDHGLDAPS